MKRGDKSPKRESRASSPKPGSSATRKPPTSSAKMALPSPLSTPSAQESQPSSPTMLLALLTALQTQLEVKDRQIAELTRQLSLVVERHYYNPAVTSIRKPKQNANVSTDNEELSDQPAYDPRADAAERKERDDKADHILEEIENALQALQKETHPEPPMPSVGVPVDESVPA